MGRLIMQSGSVKILLTGVPGCGKTSAVMNILARLNCKKVAGFYTQEIREGGIRKGFRWKSLDGAEGILAHVEIKGARRVSKYNVDVAGFEKSVVPILNTRRSGAELFVMDEIGKMECFSEKFVEAIRQLLDSERAVLATVAQKGSGLIAEVKKHPQAELFKLTHQNHDEIITEILRLLSFLKVQ